ncbi:MAG: hypothetical protein K6F78_05250 [Bacteroidaceae bacterium]|nr:hypothetical protein [Bacteroidaceae bacterium]
METGEKLAKLDEMFGSYKAEWLRGKIFNFFATPYYFSTLKDNRPCILQGGRGTGKTTVLRGLSYQGQYAILNQELQRFDQNSFIGIYYRVNTNHAHSFKGRGIDDEVWANMYAHYFNLLICWEISKFLQWHKKKNQEDEVLSGHLCGLISKSLHIDRDVNSFDLLCQELESAMYAFQSDVNNVSVESIPRLSMPGDPIKLFVEQALNLEQFQGKMFYLLIDEYENLLDGQQQIINTLLKHVPETYTIKIGVRELGWRVKYTMNKEELLNDPADYSLINITEQFSTNEKDFASFASDVCNLRIGELFEGEEDANNFSIEKSLPSMTIEEESELLKVRTSEYYEKFVEFEREHNMVLDLTPLYKFFLAYWADIHHDSIVDTVKNYELNSKKWDERYDNYKYGLLFKIHRGRGASGIQKYYAGWSTFLKLANGNIRYLMALVYRSYYIYLQNEGDITKPIPFDKQTEAAHDVGWKNLTELEGYWNKGVQLTKLVMSLGSLFGKIAIFGDKSAPELVQFEIKDEMSERTQEIINASVMNLAMIRMSSNKLSGKEIKSYQYSLHPIFAPYFLFSFRRKRKMSLTDADIQGCIDKPEDTVANILKRRKVVVEDEEKTYKQPTLFDLWQ